MLWILSPFVHTSPVPQPPGRWEVAFVRKEDMTPDGTFVWGLTLRVVDDLVERLRAAS